jgi:hypothetical protein
MDSIKEKAAATLAVARRHLLSKGDTDSAATVVAIWDVCFGGCDFDLNAQESALACDVAKFLFSSPSSVEILLRSATRKISDPTIRDEVRKISGIFSRKISAPCPPTAHQQKHPDSK